MGVVYRAMHTKLEKVVAIKLLPKSRMADIRSTTDGRLLRTILSLRGSQYAVISPDGRFCGLPGGGEGVGRPDRGTTRSEGR